jgi:hypothetical protein
MKVVITTHLFSSKELFVEAVQFNKNLIAYQLLAKFVYQNRFSYKKRTVR